MKKVISLFLSALIISVCFISTNKVNADTNEYVSKYVTDSIVSFYSGEFNTKSGHDSDSTVWENLVDSNSISLTTNSTNKFVSDGFMLDTTKQNFTSVELDCVNGNEFSLEFLVKDFKSKGKDFNTFINSGNDNFAFFRRVSTDIFEFKFAGVSASSRPTIKNADETLNEETLIAITFKVGGKVKVYINGVLKAEKACGKAMGADSLFFGHSDTSRNYTATFKSFRFYSKELTASEIEQNTKADNIVSTDDIITPVNNVELGNTNIIGGISGVRYIESKEELNNVMLESHAPKVCVFEVNENLEITVTENTKFSLDEAINLLNERIIPGFVVYDKKTVDNLTSHLKKTKYYDVFIISDNLEVIEYSKSKYPNASYAIDYSKVESINLSSIRSEIHKSGANVAILPISLSSKENVQKLFEMGVNVWAKLNEETDKEIFQAIVSGSIGVITDKTGILASIASTDFNSNSLTRAPLNIAHRGMLKEAPENTIEGALLAVSNGSNVIELDIQLTTDKKLAVMHDAKTDRTCNQNLTVEDCSMATLKQVLVNKGFENSQYANCHIPELKEYFETFKDTDVMFFIEIKSYKSDIVSYLKACVEEYNMQDRICVISFTSAQIDKVNELMPNTNIGLLLNTLTLTEDVQGDVVGLKSTIGKYKSTLNPDKTGLNASYVEACYARGISIYSWTFNTLDEYTEAILAGYQGITGNRANLLHDVPKTIEAVFEDKEYHVGDSITFDVSVTSYDGNVIKPESNIEIKLVDINRTDKTIDNKITFTKKGTVDLVIAYTFTLNDTEITIYTDVISINVLPKEQVEPVQEEKGCGSSIGISVVSVIVLSISVIGFSTKKKDE